MKKFFLIFAAVVLTAFSADVFAQGIQQTTTINATHNYWVNSTDDGATQNVAGHTGSSYAWKIYLLANVGDDYTAAAWDNTATAAVAATDYNFVGSSTAFNTKIKWLKTGDYVVEVMETSATDGCTTIRRFGVSILELDLLTVTTDHLSAQLTAVATYCNTNSGDVWGNTNEEDLNDETLLTMKMTYTVTLSTKRGSTTSTDLIGSALPDALWKFTAVDASTIPTAAGGSVTWTVTDGTITGGYLTGEANEIFVANGVSTVTIEAEIQNIAAANVNDYKLNFTIAPSSVLVENGGAVADDYLEGQEPTANDGTLNAAGTGAFQNDAYEITVNPIPNTTTIKFN